MANDPAAARLPALLECPVGCAFLLTIERDGVPLADALSGPRAFARAAIALRALSPWSPAAATARANALAAAPRLAALARQIIGHPAAAWWWSPLDRKRQLWIDRTAGSGPIEEPSSSRGRPPAAWERYAQRPEGWRITSTVTDGASCLDAMIALGVGEWSPRGQSRRLAAIDAAARVFEIANADDWHTLCSAFPGVNQSADSPAGPDSLAPDWVRAAADWDGVHLSFAGLLSAPFVRRESPSGSSMLWSWDSEGTIWFGRDVLSARSAPLPATALRAVDVTAPLDLA